MDRLRNWLRAWLGVPETGRDLEEAMAAARGVEQRVNRAALTAEHDLRVLVAQARAIMAPTADYEHTMRDLQDMHLKFDALVEALGVVIVPGPEPQDKPTIAPADGKRQLLRSQNAQKVLEAELILRELRQCAARARTHVDAVARIEQALRKRHAQ